jgi:hypothetical protein
MLDQGMDGRLRLAHRKATSDAAASSAMPTSAGFSKESAMDAVPSLKRAIPRIRESENIQIILPFSWF